MLMLHWCSVRGSFSGLQKIFSLSQTSVLSSLVQFALSCEVERFARKILRFVKKLLLLETLNILILLRLGSTSSGEPGLPGIVW